MADQEQVVYPRAFLAMDSGDLTDVTDFDAGLNTGAKQQHTMRKEGAGISWSARESVVSFNFLIGEDGPERNYWRMAEKKQIKQLRIKIPGGEVFTYNGAYREIKFNGNVEDATKGSATFVGHKENSA